MSVATLSKTQVQVQRQTLAADAIGGRTKTWATNDTLWMRVQPLSRVGAAGVEGYYAGRQESRVTHRVYVAGKPDIIDTDRLKPIGSVDGTDVWDSTHSLYILSVMNIDMCNEFLTIDCVERVDA